jgi:hypothetical protein
MSLLKDPATLAALDKGLDRLARDLKLQPGNYPVDAVVTLLILGDVTKDRDSEYTPTADIPLLPTIALLLQRAGFTRDRSMQLLIECASEALAAGGKVGDAIAERLVDAEEALATVRAAAATLPKKSRSGSTRFNGVVREISAVATTA